MLYQVPLSVFQMKRAILIIIQWCVVVGISLQITVTSSPFPIAGDTLKPDMILFGFFKSAGLCAIAQQQYIITNYTQEQGLPSGTISGIYKDTTGYVWLTGEEGVSRFDEYPLNN